MEELVNRLAALRIESESLAAQADLAVYHKGYDRDISALEKKLNELKEFEKHVRFAYEWRIGELSTEMRNVSAQIKAVD
jgi:3-keto-L-gulonate-6-phosphate decarboxylase